MENYQGMNKTLLNHTAERWLGEISAALEKASGKRTDLVRGTDEVTKTQTLSTVRLIFSMGFTPFPAFFWERE
jgi:hypothetical protein